MDQARRSYAWRAVTFVAVAVAALLAATAGHYGYHRDELYFRLLSRHLNWGFVDQPPMTPALVRAATALFGDNLFALRLPAMVSLVVTVYLVAALARELGGGPAAQLVSAIGILTPFPLTAGHLLLTASPDLCFWTLTILLVLRALLRGAPSYWLWAGVTVGAALWNKQLIVLLALGLLGGLLIAGPRRELLRWQLWAGAGIAVLIALPTLIWQATNGWPELTMARAISANKGGDDRLTFLPLQVFLLGAMVAIWIPGLVAMFRRPEWRAVRSLAWAYPIVSVIVLVTGGQVYYTFGLLALYLAAGSVRLWSARATPWLLLATLPVAVVVALPVIPVRWLPATHIADLNQATRDAIGWPEYAREVGEAYQALPPSQRAATGLIAGNYGEAGALDRYGSAYHLPRVHSGHNQLYFYGPPPDSDVNALVVGHDPADPPESAGFASCSVVGTLDNGVGVDNEEQGRQILFCRGRTEPWSRIWPAYQHYD